MTLKPPKNVPSFVYFLGFFLVFGLVQLAFPAKKPDPGPKAASTATAEAPKPADPATATTSTPPAKGPAAKATPQVAPSQVAAAPVMPAAPPSPPPGLVVTPDRPDAPSLSSAPIAPPAALAVTTPTPPDAPAVAALTADAPPAATARLPDSVLSASGEADYGKALWNPLHFKPAIDTATNEQCLACHQEILQPSVRALSPAGVKAASSTAWYQTLDTYVGEQDTFHRRHLTSPMAQRLMNLSCSFCHQGSNPREEAPVPPTAGNAGHTLRKQTNPETTCLACHGQFPWRNMEGLPGPWHEVRGDFESADSPNGCLSCHNPEGGFRTERHKVTYLKHEAIEQAATENADTCYGCHGGRAWYRISFPYPRTPWAGMPDGTPDWARGRPTASDPRHALPKP